MADIVTESLVLSNIRANFKRFCFAIKFDARVTGYDCAKRSQSYEIVRQIDVNMSINAIYVEGGIYVFIKNQEKEIKRLLGDEQTWLGTSLSNAQRKLPHRRGPSDRQLIETCQRLGFTSNQDQIVALTLNEAFLLMYHHKCLLIEISDYVPKTTFQDHQSQQSLQEQQVIIACEPTTSERQISGEIQDGTFIDGDKLDLKSCWLKFRDLYKKWNKAIDFGVEFSVYYHYYSLGWLVKSGENYGTNFLLYERGPSIDHARFGCIIVQRSSSSTTSDSLKYDTICPQMTYQSIMAHSRVIQSVSKKLLIAVVDIPNNDFFNDQLSSGGLRKVISIDVEVDDIYERFIKELKINSKTFTRHSINLTTI